jgi:hypothetical protein
MKRAILTIFFMYLNQRFETLLSASQTVLRLRYDFISSELNPRLAFDERGGNLHDDRLDGVRGRPTLLSKQFHTDGASYQNVATFRGKKSINKRLFRCLKKKKTRT